MAYHSLIFEVTDNNGNKKIINTWNNWHLIPTSRPVIAQPTPNYNYVDVPGRDGSLDFSDYLIGRPTYSDRSGSFSFYVANEDPVTGKNYGNWASRKQDIAQFLDGQTIMKMTLEDDINYYYVGRFYLKEWSPGPNFSQVTIEYRVGPYKHQASDGGAVIG